MQDELPKRIEGASVRTVHLIRRVVHGKQGEKIWIDVPCERCEKERCRLLGLNYPQPDWGTSAWVHPQPVAILPAFTRPPMPPSDGVPKWLVRAADAWAAKALDATADKRPVYPSSVEPPYEEQPSPSGRPGSGGSAPF